jgi:alkaline phosphatase/alkaline phosphatase D
MNYERYYNIGDEGIGERVPELVSAVDWQQGFIGLETIASLQPLFWVANGDNVYYDHPYSLPAKTREELLAKWHRQFSMPRIRKLMCQVPSYWLKDDHDYRFNDADTTNRKYAEPSHQLGIRTFQEVVPITDPELRQEPTYRTYRVNNLLQIWMMEGRDYRSPNNLPDTAGKTLWGEEQIEWLQQTLTASDAPFKIIISPTPLIGPDDAYKKDNHTNPGGFQYEQKQIFNWLIANDFQNQNLYFMCGDRHWQYHSRHPLGFEEFGSGALVDQNARTGRMPGDPKSTDPDAQIEQIFIQKEPTGGFVQVTVKPDPAPNIIFEIKDEKGSLLHAVQYKAKAKTL